MLDNVFGSPDAWPDSDLIGYSDEFDPALALVAYRCGVFPMPVEQWMGWWSPLRRAVLLPGGLRITRSLRKTAARYTTTVDRAFPDVLAACADPKRPDGWIDDRIAFAYTALNQAGYAHSVETWDSDGRLVGGLYGVHQAGMFAGESMFHHPELGRDASQVAPLRPVPQLARAPLSLPHRAWPTPPPASLGVVELSRRDYLARLGVALEGEHRNTWSNAERWNSRRLLAAHV